MYKAIFLDRDGTLSTQSPQKISERNRVIGEIIGKPDFHITTDMNERFFWRVMDLPGIRSVNTLAREGFFWKKWFQLILEDHGVKLNSEAFAADLYKQFPLHRMMVPYPETISVLDELKNQGYPMGVISDTFPSLEESLKAMGIAHYFQSFTASSLVGAGKPDPRIFRAATESLGVKAQDSIFVDDYKEEADGARNQGFISFHLVRELTEPDFANWTIGNLMHLLEFLRDEND